ncbi:beta-N-acetylhexosaminidase [Gudongella sp. SC589]|uniref:beta-N-acetylhexosaminidase n=1 Tax=Gudongella sp. SC589 TaxID=3385990 RepID=UPI003904AEF2
MKKLVYMMLLVFMLAGCGQADQDKTPVEPPAENPPHQAEEPPTREELLVEAVKAMTLQEKIGQLLMGGFEGTEISQREVSLIEDYHIGGFIFFGRNITDEEGRRNLIRDLKSINYNSPIPLFLAVDEEGGSVTRLSGIFRNLPPQSRLGERGDPDTAYEYGAIQGEKLGRLGFNVNFSPVLDVDSNPDNPVIGNRAISQNPGVVSELGIKVWKGISDQGVVPVGKHYPGHGDTDVDSHTLLPVIDKSKEELLSTELIPFQASIDYGIPALMVGHLLIPALDDKPASLSGIIMKELLREDQGFDGVLFSDDLTMGAIVGSMTVSEAAVEFIAAGGDVALICHGETNLVEAFEAIEAAVGEGSLLEEDIDCKVVRIIRLKEDFDLKEEAVRDTFDDELDNRIEGLFD